MNEPIVSSTDVTFRQMAVSDAGPLYDLGSRCLDWPFETVFWAPGLIDNYAENSRKYCFVAECEKQLVGFSLALVSGRIGYVGWLAVAPEFRGRGVSESLLRRSLDSLDSEDLDFVMTLAREPLTQFCRRFGFVPAEQGKVVMIRAPVEKLRGREVS